MKIQWALGAALVVALGLLLWSQAGKSEALVRAEIADSIADALTDELEDAIERSRTVRDSMLEVDQELAELQADADARIEEATTDAVRARTALRDVSARLTEHLAGDTLALALTAEQDSLHADALAAKDMIIAAQASEIDALTLWGNGWRTQALQSDSLLTDALAALEVREQAQSSLEAEIRRLNRRGWIYRGAGLLAVGVAAVSVVTR